MLNNYITIFPFPLPQGILQSGDTLFASQGAISYQWYLGGNMIPAATDYFYVATISGDYNVVATDANGCEVEAAVFNVIAEVSKSYPPDESINVSPNPVSGIVTISTTNVSWDMNDLTLYTLTGNFVDVFSLYETSYEANNIF